MKCLVCGHKKICKFYARFLEIQPEFEFGGVQVDITDCDINKPRRSSESTEGITFNSAQQPQDVTIVDETGYVDYERRSSIIKSVYRDANKTPMICPSCKTEVDAIYKCVDCCAPVCDVCGVIVTTDKGDCEILCQDCWAEAESNSDIPAQEEQLSPDDIRFIHEAVKINMPDK
jgi:hypothetical protein